MSTANFHKFRIFLCSGVWQMSKMQQKKCAGAADAAPAGKLLYRGYMEKRIKR